MSWITPVYNRTATDIANLTDKAYFNVSDWARIYGNAVIVYQIISIVLEVDIEFVYLAIPDMSTIPNVISFNFLLANLNRIRVASGLPFIVELATLNENWLAGKYAVTPTYEDVNKWERFVDLLRSKFVSGLIEFWIYCGVSAAGQPRFYQHRWREYPFVADSVSPVQLARAGISTCGVELLRNNMFRRYD